MDKKVALITGASSGIGLAIALVFAEHGYAVLAAGRDKKRTEEIVTHNQNIRTWLGDLTTSEGFVT
jgi:NADP-dependent 3-hydroxy acid dehydrogenase YdfG